MTPAVPRNRLGVRGRASWPTGVIAAFATFAPLSYGQAGTVTLNPTPRCVVVSALDVQVNLSGAGVPVVGGQFFLEFDPAILQYTGVQPGNAPFTLVIFSQGNQSLGTIDLAVGVPGGGPGPPRPPPWPRSCSTGSRPTTAPRRRLWSTSARTARPRGSPTTWATRSSPR